MNTHCEKSIAYFMNDLSFCVQEMLHYYAAKDIIIKMTKDAAAILHSVVSDVLLPPYQLWGIDLELVDKIDSPMGFVVMRKEKE